MTDLNYIDFYNFVIFIFIGNFLFAIYSRKMLIANLTSRLAELIPALPPLRALAEAQGLSANIALDDAPRLFFPHSIYKSYDPAWLANHDFTRMGQWLQNFTTVGLKSEETPPFHTIDDWLTWLENERGVDIAHSSGTTGRMSLIARTKEDAAARQQRNRLGLVDAFTARGVPEDAMWHHIAWPGAAGGRTTQQKLAEGARITGAKSPDHFIPLFDEDLGVDYELYVVRARLARAQGQLDLPPPSAYVQEKLTEAERRQADYPLHLQHMLDRLEALRGERVLTIGSPHSLAAMARAGLDRGMTGGFAQHSAHLVIGGLKGLEAPPQFAATMQGFFGSSIPINGYGATETNTGYFDCSAGRYHIPPWVIAWVLDPTNDWQPRPREGVQEGRAAFLDLALESGWGGVVTADHVEIDYRPCACGRASPSISPHIRRVMDRDGDYSWTPATTEAMNAAIEKLHAF